MPSKPRNMPEQEHSIRARSDELFLEEAPVGPARTTKPFAFYLRETPARPLSPAFLALIWVIGAIVAVLFLVAIWRVSHRPARKSAPGAAPAKVAATVAFRRALAADFRAI